MPIDTYKSQRRGGKGITAMTTKGEDFCRAIIITTTIIIYCSLQIKVKFIDLRFMNIPESNRQSKGTAIINLLYIYW